ncbi:MAG: hypothetical protein GX139_02445 [Armatimonadetes bacterium]|nr:hypothetical protein [Armatimonadota bacterium]
MNASRSTRTKIRTKSPLRKRKRTPKKIVPAIARVLVFAVVAVVGIWVFNKAMRPLKLIKTEQRDKDRIVSQYNALHEENERLRRQLTGIKTRSGIVQAARKQGFVKPGEISLVIPEQQPANPN